MVQFCCVLGCGNRSNRDRKKFFRLPSIPKTCQSRTKAELIITRRQQWLDNIDRIDLKDGDSSYSPGYIRVCSDHFCTGKPSNVMNVDHRDWAPTVRMGSGPIKMKGSKQKQQMLGFPSLKRDRQKKSAQQTYVRKIPLETDAREIQRRRKLARYAQMQDKKKHYISLKSVRRATDIINTQPQPVLPTMAKKTCMRGNKLTPVMFSQIKNEILTVPAGTGVAIEPSQSNQTYKSPIIHKISVDTTELAQQVVNSSGKSDEGRIPDIRDIKMFDESSNSECSGTFLEKCGVKLFDDSTNSVSNDSFANDCGIQGAGELQTIHELMNGHLSVKTEIKEEPAHCDV